MSAGVTAVPQARRVAVALAGAAGGARRSASLVLGLATLFVFRRGLPHVGWIVGYLLLLVALSSRCSRRRARRSRRTAGARGERRRVHDPDALPQPPPLRAARLLGSRRDARVGRTRCSWAGWRRRRWSPRSIRWYRARAPGPRGWMQRTCPRVLDVRRASTWRCRWSACGRIMALLGSAALAVLGAHAALPPRRGPAGRARACSLAIAVALVAVAAVWAGRVLRCRRRRSSSRDNGGRARRREPRAGGSGIGLGPARDGGRVGRRSPRTPRCTRRRGCAEAIEHVWRQRRADHRARRRCPRCWAAAPRAFARGRARADLQPPLAGTLRAWTC